MNKKEVRRVYCLGLVLAILLAGSIGVVSAGDVVVIANKNVQGDSLTASDIKDIFLGKKTTWDNREAIEFVILKDGPTHEAFLKTYVDKTPSQYKNYWTQQVFTGKGKYPKAFESEGEMLDYIGGNAGSIGYVSAMDKDIVKTITVK